MSNVTPIGAESSVGRVEPRPSEARVLPEFEPAARRGDDRVEVSPAARWLSEVTEVKPAPRLNEADLRSFIDRLLTEPPARADVVARARELAADETYPPADALDAALDDLIDDAAL